MCNVMLGVVAFLDQFHAAVNSLGMRSAHVLASFLGLSHQVLGMRLYKHTFSWVHEHRNRACNARNHITTLQLWLVTSVLCLISAGATILLAFILVGGSIAAITIGMCSSSNIPHLQLYTQSYWLIQSCNLLLLQVVSASVDNWSAAMCWISTIIFLGCGELLLLYCWLESVFMVAG